MSARACRHPSCPPAFPSRLGALRPLLARRAGRRRPDRDRVHAAAAAARPGGRPSCTARWWGSPTTRASGPRTRASTWARRTAPTCTRCATARSGTGAPATSAGTRSTSRPTTATPTTTRICAVHAALGEHDPSVKAGDVIEFVDHTGNANGFDHLHFEVRLGGPNGTRSTRGRRSTPLVARSASASLDLTSLRRRARRVPSRVRRAAPSASNRSATAGKQSTESIPAATSDAALIG